MLKLAEGQAAENQEKQRSAYLVVEDGPVSVRIYKRTKQVNDADYTVFELADYSEGFRRLRSFSDEEKAVKEAGRIAGLMRKGDSEGLKRV
jgi:plasmid rolling circle replication initiator protein Rep